MVWWQEGDPVHKMPCSTNLKGSLPEQMENENRLTQLYLEKWLLSGSSLWGSCVGAWMVGKVWSRYEEPKEEVENKENEVLERKISYKTVVVTEVTPEMHFYAQNTETGELLLSYLRTCDSRTSLCSWDYHSVLYWSPTIFCLYFLTLRVVSLILM